MYRFFGTLDLAQISGLDQTPDSQQRVCGKVPAREATMEHRRHQSGSLIYQNSRRGHHDDTWAVRYLEDIIVDGKPKRVHRSKVLGFAREISKDQALRLKDKLLWPLNHGDHGATEYISFEAFHQRWEKDLLPALRDSTASFYRQNAKYYILPHFKGKLLRDIKPLEVQQFINEFKGKAGSLLTHIRATLNKLFKTAVRWRYLESNPADGLQLPSGKPPQRAAVYSPEQVGLLLRHLLWPERGLVLLGFVGCLRPSELFAVRWGDITEHGVAVSRRIYRNRFGDPKTPAATRLIPLDTAVLVELNKMRGPDDQLIFKGLKGSPLRSDKLVKNVREIAAKLNLPRFRWHSLRRSGETALHNNGVSIKNQMAMLGHTNPAITMLYAESTEAGKQGASKTLADAVFANLAEEPSRFA
jgi:integrase